MHTQEQIESWFQHFPAIAGLADQERKLAADNVEFLALDNGAIAYQQGADCPNYLMCIEGQTRVYTRSPSGKEILIYRVGAGGTCVLTTQCLLTGGTFPAESVAEAPVRLAAIPAESFHKLLHSSDHFRQFVLNDYGRLLGGVIDLVDQLAFRSIEERLSMRLQAEADKESVVRKTHQQLAHDLGCVREVVSRHLSDWEARGWIETARGTIIILNQEALATELATK